MNLFNELKNKEINIAIDYYGDKDLCTRWECADLIKYFEIVKNLINATTFDSIENFDDYINYLMLIKISSFSEMIENIIAEDNKNKISILSNIAKDKIKSVTVQDFIKYINSTYIDLLNNEDISSITLDFCIKYQNGISNTVFIWLAENKPYIFIGKYDTLKKQFIKPEIIEKVLNNKNVEKLIYYDDKKLYCILKSLDKKNIPCLIAFNSGIYAFYKNIYNKLSIDNVLQYFNILKSIKRYFEDIKFSKANECNKIFKQVELLLDESIKQNGKTFSYEIPVKEFDKVYYANTKWEHKLIGLTHSLNKKTNKFESIFKYKKTARLIDDVSSNIDKDDYFTYSRQQDIGIALKVGSSILQYIFSKKEFAENVTGWIRAIIDYVCKSIAYESDDILKEYEIIIDTFFTWINNNWSQNISVGQSLCYSIQMLLCASIEKLLRVIYKSKTETLFLDYDFSLSIALKDKSIIQPILSEDLAKVCHYVLCKENHIGNNYRNRLAHLYDFELKTINPEMNFQLLYLYVCVLNSIFLDCLKDK